MIASKANETYLPERLGQPQWLIMRNLEYDPGILGTE